MAQKLKIAAISGSLRKGSYNTAALRAARELQPQGMEIEVITLEGIEPFNEDVEAEGWPPNVQVLRDKVAPAHGVLFATPEYNYSMPGVLKNAIDWWSRPTGKGPIVDKPAAIIGASLSKIGTARAQAHLRQSAFYNAMPLLPTAEVLISNASEIFDDQGRLADADTRKFLSEMLVEFGDWVRMHASNHS
mgnify:CR=1 FL=1